MTAREISGRDPASGRPIVVQVTDGIISAIEPGKEDGSAFLSPGLIDLQVNGFEGIDLNSGRLVPGDVAAIAAALRRQGVTSFLPTIVTASEESIVSALAAIAAARRTDEIVAHSIPYIHVEGPWVSPEDGPRGAHPREHVRAPDLDEFDRWQDACGGLVGMVTLSPHYENVDHVVAALARQGVHVAIGHTGAAPEQIRAAADAGATLSTHLGNGAAAVLPRHPNFIWTQLAEDRLSATLIADRHHLPADTFKAMVRAKGLANAILVSDVVSLGGMAPGFYDQPIGGRVELTPEGCLRLAGTPYLAGAALPLSNGVANATAMASIGLSDALRLATSNPGRFIGGRGRLEIGADADLIRFSWQPGAKVLAIEQTLVRGRDGR